MKLNYFHHSEYQFTKIFRDPRGILRLFVLGFLLNFWNPYAPRTLLMSSLAKLAKDSNYSLQKYSNWSLSSLAKQEHHQADAITSEFDLSCQYTDSDIMI